MKKIIIVSVALLAVLLGYLAMKPASESEQPLSEKVQTARISIPVEGMTCSACAAGVKSALTRMEGVEDVEVDLAGRKANVDYVESDVSPAQIVSAITELGYKAGKPVRES